MGHLVLCKEGADAVAPFSGHSCHNLDVRGHGEAVVDGDSSVFQRRRRPLAFSRKVAMIFTTGRGAVDVENQAELPYTAQGLLYVGQDGEEVLLLVEGDGDLV